MIDTSEKRCVLTQKISNILSEVYKVSPWSPSYIAADLSNDHSQYFFAEENEKIIGFLAISSFMDELEITNLAVLPTCQGKGVASRLLTELSVFSGLLFLEVRESNLAAQHLYEKFGFAVYHSRKNYYENPRENALLMRKEQ